jgi:putative membrane protein
MKRPIRLTASSLALSLALAPVALAQSETQPLLPQSPDAVPGASVGPGTPGASEPLTYVDTASFVSNAASFLQLAIDSSRLAVTQSGSDTVRAFADQTAQDAAQARQALATGAEEGGVDYPESPDWLLSGHEQMLQTLASKTGEAFDRDYLNVQLQIHRQMQGMFEVYGLSGENEALRSFAAEMAPMIEAHLEQLAAAGG